MCSNRSNVCSQKTFCLNDVTLNNLHSFIACAVQAHAMCYTFYPTRHATLGIMANVLCHWLKRKAVANRQCVASGVQLAAGN